MTAKLIVVCTNAPYTDAPHLIWTPGTDCGLTIMQSTRGISLAGSSQDSDTHIGQDVESESDISATLASIIGIDGSTLDEDFVLLSVLDESLLDAGAESDSEIDHSTKDDSTEVDQQIVYNPEIDQSTSNSPGVDESLQSQQEIDNTTKDDT